VLSEPIQNGPPETRIVSAPSVLDGRSGTLNAPGLLPESAAGTRAAGSIPGTPLPGKEQEENNKMTTTSKKSGRYFLVISISFLRHNRKIHP
jgi:hypothetical protein